MQQVLAQSWNSHSLGADEARWPQQVDRERATPKRAGSFLPMCAARVSGPLKRLSRTFRGNHSYASLRSDARGSADIPILNRSWACFAGG
jgi:hypothetical protein